MQNGPLFVYFCKMKPFLIPFFCLFALSRLSAQLPIAWDTISVIENGKVLKMPWANGLNFTNVSNADLNFDGKQDLVLFDRLDNFGNGRFRCFVNTGNPGELKYFADPVLSYYFPKSADWAILKDYDNDGKADIFCSIGSSLRAYRNTSNPPHLAFTLAKSTIISDYFPQGSNGISALYVNPVAVPGIVDVDGDGDLDVLTFSATGVLIQWHKNMSMEKYGKPDSLEFQLEDDCWGKVAESSCTANLSYSYCTQQASTTFPQLPAVAGKEYHAGSCLTCLDSDGDSDLDLIIGDILCQTPQYMHNVGTPTAALFGDTTKMYPNYPAKGNTTQPLMNSFPCAYIVDADNDGKQDLVVTPNSLSSENYKSVWLYRNVSLTNTVNFQFVKNNFLQDEMIDVGQNSIPLLLDYDADGIKDLIIGNYGYYQGNTASARLTLYRNTGTGTQPSFSLVTRDYASLAQYSLNGIMATAGDIDNDNDVDICIGVTSGQVHWLENTGGQGNLCNFSVLKNNPFGFTTVSSGAIPQLFDLDSDGKLDLLIGMQNGNIAFYRNTGTVTPQNVLVPSFSLVTNTLGNVNLKSDPLVYGYEGDAAPYFFKENGSIKLLAGCITGAIAYYNVPSDILSPYDPISGQVNGYNEGGQSTLCYEDINGDGIRDMFIGNSAGGLKFYSSKSVYVSIEEIDNLRLNELISLFPNPLYDELTIRIDELEFKNGSCRISNLLGQEVQRQPVLGNTSRVDVSALSPGIYLTEISIEQGGKQLVLTKKLIKQ